MPEQVVVGHVWVGSLGELTCQKCGRKYGDAKWLMVRPENLVEAVRRSCPYDEDALFAIGAVQRGTGCTIKIFRIFPEAPHA
jgi:hypothetical protein